MYQTLAQARMVKTCAMRYTERVAKSNTSQVGLASIASAMSTNPTR